MSRAYSLLERVARFLTAASSTVLSSAVPAIGAVSTAAGAGPLGATALVFLTWTSELGAYDSVARTYDRLGGTDETKEGSDHTENGEKSGGESSSDVWHLLDGLHHIEATEVCPVSTL